MKGNVNVAGSKTHLRTSRNECPYNKSSVNDSPTLPHKDDDASQPYRDLSDNLSPAGDISSDESESTSGDDWCYEDDIISSDMSVCGALGRAHKRLSHEPKEWSSYRSVQY